MIIICNWPDKAYQQRRLLAFSQYLVKHDVQVKALVGSEDSMPRVISMNDVVSDGTSSLDSTEDTTPRREIADVHAHGFPGFQTLVILSRRAQRLIKASCSDQIIELIRKQGSHHVLISSPNRSDWRHGPAIHKAIKITWSLDIGEPFGQFQLTRRLKCKWFNSGLRCIMTNSIQSISHATAHEQRANAEMLFEGLEAVDFEMDYE